VGNRAGSTPAPGTKTASKEAVFLVLNHNEFQYILFFLLSWWTQNAIQSYQARHLSERLGFQYWFVFIIMLFLKY
jgi:hypothetical protein